MLDFTEELIIETYKIPWLIWIQILVLLLLMILLYCFSLFPLDLSTDNTSKSNNCNNSLASASGSSSISRQSHLGKNPVGFKHNSTVTRRLQPSQVGEIQSIKGEIATSTARRIVRAGEEITERDSSSSSSSSNIYYHPCYYFRIAREAFLKCLGLGMEPVPDNSWNRKQKKDK